MPPIPVYSDAPITPQHPDGITPSTTSAHAADQSAPNPTQTTDLPASNTVPSGGPPPPQPGAVPYPPAQPGARPPAPTGSYASPPQPQPGSVPTVTATVTQTTTIQSPFPSNLPPQFGLPPPTQNFAPTKSTAAAAAPAGLPSLHQHPLPAAPPVQGANPYNSRGTDGPALGERRHSIEHPPGYMQNPYAADGTPEQRARLHEVAEQERDNEGVLGNVRKVVGELGENIGKVENNVWKWVGGGK